MCVFVQVFTGQGWSLDIEWSGGQWGAYLQFGDWESFPEQVSELDPVLLPPVLMSSCFAEQEFSDLNGNFNQNRKDKKNEKEIEKTY